MNFLKRILGVFRGIFGRDRGPRVTRLSDDDPRVVDAMRYARALLRVEREPAPVRWHTLAGETFYSKDGMWCRKTSTGGYDAGGQTQYLDGYTRVIVYVGPDGQQPQYVWRHEAVHAVGREIIEGDHPERTTTGIRLRGVVPHW